MSPQKLSFLYLLTVFLLLGKLLPSSSSDTNFIFNDFKSSNLTLDGLAQITSGGLLELTNRTFQKKGHAFYPNPIRLKSSSSSSNSSFSFSTSFVFAIHPEISDLSGHGIVFIITPKPSLPYSTASQYLGVLNLSSNGNTSNHLFGVELDTIESTEFSDINNNHIGIDINSLKSDIAAPTSYFLNTSSYKNLTLFSGQPMRVWVEYDSGETKITVTIAPIDIDKPKIPLLTLHRDLSPVFKDEMYVGFSSATGSVYTYHYILAWSFAINQPATEINISKLPKLPRTTPKHMSKFITIGIPIIAVAALLAVGSGISYFLGRRKKFAEEMDDWETDYGPHRFKYRDLYIATKGFKEKGMLGAGGFGRVYRGILPTSKIEIAVKKISHDSKQGMREFVAEIASLGRLRHRNLVQLLGYCRRKGELLLVYDYMPNGSLDKYLHFSSNQSRNNLSEAADLFIQTLNWRQRFKIIKGVASGLLYLHEEWEQVVVHRDIKASNVLLDGDLNGRLGDFGLARLYDHGTDPQTTHVVGTLGYLAPEHTRTGRATRSTDVFAFGAFLLEVVCGRRPIDLKAENEEMVLVDWVFLKWKSKELLSVVDVRLEGEFDEEEVTMVLKLGMICSSVEPGMRPTMREVVGYLEGVVKLPDFDDMDVELSSGGVVFNASARWRVGGVVVGGGGSGVMMGLSAGREGFSDHVLSSYQYPSSMATAFTHSSSIAESVLSEGR